MEELIRILGLPVISGLFLLGAYFVAREAWSLLRVQRQSAYEAALGRTLDELDSRLNKFYLPLRERLSVTQHIYDVARNATVTAFAEPFGPAPAKPGIYIQSTDKRVFTTLVERDILIPLNDEMVRLVLDRASFRDPSDDTNYGALVYHYLLWGALWRACDKDTIQRFSTVSVLDFPAAEAARFHAVCDRLLSQREHVRQDALNMRRVLLVPDRPSTRSGSVPTTVAANPPSRPAEIAEAQNGTDHSRTR